MAKTTLIKKAPRSVGQTTATRRVKAAPVPKMKPQARARGALARVIDDAASPAARRQTFDALKRPAWARFEAFQAADGSEAEIDIYDVIGTWELNADTFRRQLKAITANRITLNINSPGGSVFDAFAMFEDLRDHSAHIHVRIRGIAASAASLVAMAGDTVEIADNGFLMIHNAWVLAMGDKREMASSARLLGQIDKRLAATYAEAAAGRDVKDAADAAGFAELMDAETWLDSNDALAAGLVDSVGAAAPSAEFAGLDVSHFAKTPAVVVRASKAKPKTEAKPAPAAELPDVSAVSAAIKRCIETLS